MARFALLADVLELQALGFERADQSVGPEGSRALAETRRSPRIATTTYSFPLPMLALLIGVHLKTLRSAARDGRLPVTYDTRTTFRRLQARATPAAATQFRRSYYGRPVKPVDRRTPLTWASVPSDYDAQIRCRGPLEPSRDGIAGRGLSG